MLGNDTPKRTGIRCAYRLAFINHTGCANGQRAIQNETMADHPTEIGSRPKHLARRNIIDIFHRPAQRHQMAAIIAHHAFRDTRRAGCIENIKRVGRQHWLTGDLAFGRPCFALQCLPFKIAVSNKRGRAFIALPNETGFRLMRRQFNGSVKQRLVIDNAPRLQTARGGKYQFRFGVVEP